MGNEKITEDTVTATPTKDAPALVKKIGRTTYIVRIHFKKYEAAVSVKIQINND